MLNETNSVLVVKPHPLTPHVDITDRENFIYMDYGGVKNNQHLLMACDMLITDYSTCCIDYALLNRPITFYMPDHDRFVNYSEPLYEDYLDLCNGCKCTTLSDLASFIRTPNKLAVEAINNLYEDESIKGTLYSKNVYKAIIKCNKK